MSDPVTCEAGKKLRFRPCTHPAKWRLTKGRISRFDEPSTVDVCGVHARAFKRLPGWRITNLEEPNA
jgi:hypothetical protein